VDERKSDQVVAEAPLGELIGIAACGPNEVEHRMFSYFSVQNFT
jgi:hypothetical protein